VLDRWASLTAGSIDRSAINDDGQEACVLRARTALARRGRAAAPRHIRGRSSRAALGGGARRNRFEP